jgi:hypothetical protein
MATVADKIVYFRTEDALKVEVDIHPDTQTATLHFEVERNRPLAVTMPLAQLQRLYEHISDRLDVEPSLFGSASVRQKK